MLAKLYSSALHGVDAFRIVIEISVGNGIGYQISGLPDEGIRESLSRISVAIQQSGFQMPRTKLVINLAPAHLRKSGTAFDLPIAIGILMASGQLSDRKKLSDCILVGEIGLDGSIFPVRGALCMAYQARRDRFRGIVLPRANAGEASLVNGINVHGVSHLREVLDFIQSDAFPEPFMLEQPKQDINPAGLDFRDVRGQESVKRALEIAAAGGHNSLLIGPPGTGKTMLAKRLPTILPPLTADESLETTRIYSVGNGNEVFNGLITERPFRNPHHTTSDVALTGGGTIPTPGEISLAHNGVLFLDELPEFKRSVIEVLRQPLEERKILISRAKCSLEYPASFMFLAAMNPCLCGFLGHPTRKCTCSRRAINWYRKRISSPILERIDLHIEVKSVPLSEILEYPEVRETSAAIRERVIRTRGIQTLRYRDLPDVYCNAQIPDREIDQYCHLETDARKFLLKRMDTLQLSVRSYTRILKIARTIADLRSRDNIGLEHIAEAISLRTLDKPLTILDDLREAPKIDLKPDRRLSNGLPGIPAAYQFVRKRI